MATGRPLGSSDWRSFRNWEMKMENELTCNHLSSVVDNGLMIFIRPVGEIHTDYKNENIEEKSYDDTRTDIDTSATQFAEFLDSVDLWT